MAIQGLVREAIRRAGGEALLMMAGEEHAVAGSLQHSRGASSPEGGPLGYGRPCDAALFLPCGGAADRLERGHSVRWGGRRYRVLRVETVSAFGSPAYRRAEVREERG